LIGIGGSVRATGFFAEQAINARPADAKPAGDRRRAELLIMAQPPDFAGVDLWLAALVDATCLCDADPLQLPLAAQIGFDSANTPSMSRNALPAAVPVSIGCSVAFSATPLPFSA
jgi:hypothetical protein